MDGEGGINEVMAEEGMKRQEGGGGSECTARWRMKKNRLKKIDECKKRQRDGLNIQELR